MTPLADDSADETVVALRQLALVDRILGLEAELANLRSVSVGREVAAQVSAVKASMTWRVGRVVLFPLTLIKRVVRRR